MREKIELILREVNKPSRYIGNEIGLLTKTGRHGCSLCNCFPGYV
jgi:hypothetical protein